MSLQKRRQKARKPHGKGNPLSSRITPCAPPIFAAFIFFLFLAPLLEAQDSGPGPESELLRLELPEFLSKGTASIFLSSHSFGRRLGGPVGGKEDLYSSTIGLSYAPLRQVELSLAWEARRFAWNEGGSERTVLGHSDGLLEAKVKGPFSRGAFSWGALGYVYLPFGGKRTYTIPGTDTANPTIPRAIVFSRTSWDFGTKLLFGLDFTELSEVAPLKTYLSIGYGMNMNESSGAFNFPFPSRYPTAGGRNDAGVSFDVIHLGGAFEFPSSSGSVFAEVTKDVLFKAKSFISLNESPLTVTPGVKYSLGGLDLVGAVDINIFEDDPATGSFDAGKVLPPWELSLRVSYSGKLGLKPRDTDGDGIPNKRDKCPKEKEDFDNFEDEDGCPDPDNDGDGILDIKDKCPEEKEDLDGFEDTDGCPDSDNDDDKIPDSIDRCPNNPEDFDGFEDSDGCPDKDNDMDGIPDAKDKCPNVAETFNGYLDDDGCPDQWPSSQQTTSQKDSDTDGIPDSVDKCPSLAEDWDGFQDDDGCPDLDNDTDGIPDLKDKCPNAPETFNGYLDDDGCPDEKPTEKQMSLRTVYFGAGSAAIPQDSYTILDQIASSLLTFQDVRIEIQGYSDDAGPDTVNVTVSQKRAEAVRGYLINAGVHPSRLTAKGYGKADPVASNKTEAGRRQNRRVEFKRLMGTAP